jgi:hypothetical protein
VITAGSKHGRQRAKEHAMTLTTDHRTATRTVVRRIASDCFQIERDGEVIGFIDVAGPVYVALLGRSYAHAVEVAQTLDGEAATRAVLSVHV